MGGSYLWSASDFASKLAYDMIEKDGDLGFRIMLKNVADFKKKPLKRGTTNRPGNVNRNSYHYVCVANGHYIAAGGVRGRAVQTVCRGAEKRWAARNAQNKCEFISGVGEGAVCSVSCSLRRGYMPKNRQPVCN